MKLIETISARDLKYKDIIHRPDGKIVVVDQIIRAKSGYRIRVLGTDVASGRGMQLTYLSTEALHVRTRG